MPTYPSYSPFFSTIYDEPAPLGSLGRGAHYSVFRCAEWYDVVLEPQSKAQVHDFAVIWDEDHDRRIFDVIEEIYMAGSLAPIQFIGERKGFVSVVFASRFKWYREEKDVTFHNWIRRIEKICGQPRHGDSWNVEFGVFDRAPGSHQMETINIIADTDYKIETYLRHIDSTWSLGTKPFFKNPKSWPTDFSRATLTPNHLD